MTFREVFRFEVQYRLRQPSTWVYALVLFGIPFLMMHAIDGSLQFVNAPALMTEVSATLGNLGMLVTAGIFGDAAGKIGVIVALGGGVVGVGYPAVPVVKKSMYM